MSERPCPHCGRMNSSLVERCEHCSNSFWMPPVPPKSTWNSGKTAVLGALVFLAGAGYGLTISRQTPPPPVSPPPVVVTSTVNRPQLDVVFVIDTTGSMVDEIDVVKSQVSSMIGKIQSGQPAPYVRVGLVAFRDRGDEYVTRTCALTDDIRSIQTAVDRLVADGGGDTPESVNEALHVALNEMDWNYDQKTRRLMFLIGDAAPHTDYANDYDYAQELNSARQRGIKVHAWGCSGIEDSGDREFREIASLGGGDFQYLTYRQEVVKTDGTRAYVLYQGRDAFELKDEKANWKVGGQTLNTSGQAAELPKSSFCAPGAAGAPSLEGSYGKARSARLENNLDHVLCEQVQREASELGTKY
ncbi:MAG: vWA domain-containing protein [Candidatus Eremiobacterota bacterium]